VKVVAGGKLLKTDLRLEGTGQARPLSHSGKLDGRGAEREGQLEASRLIIEETRKERRGATPRRGPPRKA
jgi:hypothetical protein